MHAKGLPMSIKSPCLRSIAATLAFLFASLPASVSAVGVYPTRDEEAVICRNVAELLSEGLPEYDEGMATPAWVNEYALRLALRGHQRELVQRMEHSEYGFEGRGREWRYRMPVEAVQDIARHVFETRLVPASAGQAEFADGNYYFRALPTVPPLWSVRIDGEPLHFHNGCCRYRMTFTRPDGSFGMKGAMVVCPADDDSHWKLCGFGREN